MSVWSLSLGIACAIVVGFSPLRAQPSAAPQDKPDRSVWDGVYTEDQAKRGSQIYDRYCVNCHGESLQGIGEASPLTGPSYTADFNGATLGDILERTRRTMPQDHPGTMSRQQVVDVLAFMLSFNKFPAGDSELPIQAEALNQIKFLATKPTGAGTEPGRRLP